MLKVDPRDEAKLIAPLFRTSPLFVVAVAGLLLVIGQGVYMYVRQIQLGLGQTAMNRPTYWGVYMVNFIFFIGISHAGTLISAILRVTGAEWRRPITRVAEAITVFALIVGTLQIIIDMGRPDRLWYVMRYGRLQSPILWDVVSVTLYFLGSVTYLFLPLIPDAAILRDNTPARAPRWQKALYRTLALGWRGNREQWIRLEKAIALMAVFIIPIAISVHTIISWILATTVQPGWHSSIFGPYFVVGAIFSGIGALFVAMSAVRRALHLEDYIGPRQYGNLGLLFIVMNLVWAYFTYAENLGIAAGQQTEEFAVLASKLWGQYAGGFWTMIVLMIVSFWVLVVPRMWPSRQPVRLFILRPEMSVAWAGGAAVAAYLLFAPGVSWLPTFAPVAALSVPLARSTAWVLLILFALGFALAITPWLKAHPVAATVIAAVLVLVGMWLERWNIIVPTMTNPRLIASASYFPTATELSLTAASVALFLLLFLLFFRFFPAVSLWEIAEGRVIAEAQAQVTIPEPEPTFQRRGLRWVSRRQSHPGGS